MTLAFAQSSVDVESLGLDNVNKEPVLAFPVIAIDKAEKKVDNKKIQFPVIAIENNKKDEKKKAVVKEVTAVAVKEKPQVKKKEPIIKEAIFKTKNGTIIKAKKSPPPVKKVVKEVKEITQAEIEAEIREKLRIEKLEELRQKYLINGSEKMLEEKIILPQRKLINPFISEEIPAPPILGVYRTSDNTHIPVFLSLDKRINNLFKTISFGDVAFFNSAYQDVKNPNIRNELGDTLLTYSLLTQKHAISASIISKGADTNLTNRLGYTPMDIAIELKDLQNFALLINNKANINFTDKFGRTYLFHAARIGFLSAVEALVRRNVDINTIDKDGLTALDIAYKNKQEVIVQFLLKNGAKTWIEKPFDPTNTSLIKKLESRWENTF